MAKLISFLGDSITQGAITSCVEKRFTTFLCSLLGAKEQNLGLCCSRIAKQRFDPSGNDYENYTDRALKIDPEADLVIVFGGTNDFGHGDAKFGPKDSHDVYTYNGALNTLCEYLLSRFSKEKILFLIPTHRLGEDNLNGDGSKQGVWPTLSKYVAAQKERLNAYGIEWYEIQSYNPLAPGGMKKSADGLHPNEEGHRAIALELAELLKKKGF